MIKISRAALLSLALRIPGGLLCAAALIAIALDALMLGAALALVVALWALLWFCAHWLFTPALSAWVRDDPD